MLNTLESANVDAEESRTTHDLRDIRSIMSSNSGRFDDSLHWARHAADLVLGAAEGEF